MAGRAESPRPAGEHDQPLFGAIGAPDARKPAFRVAAVQIPFDNLLDDRTEIPIFPLKSALVFRKLPLTQD
jgi:hypothetical protein